MKSNFKLALLTMATLGAFSCSSDKLAEDGTQNPSQDGTDGFISFKINNVGSGMRASTFTDGSYAAGDANEYAITTEQGANVVFFFDDKGDSFGKSYLQLMSIVDNPKADGHDNEKVYSARIRKSQDNSGKKLASCVLILNADPANLESLSAMSWSKLQQELDNGLGQYGDYFTMSNTIYVNESDGNKIEGPAAITDDNICDTWDEAQENRVTVHVERVVAKFGVSFNVKNGETPILDGNNVLTISDPKKQHPLMTYNTASEQFVKSETEKWAVRITKWDVNAKETQTYYVKNLSTGSNIADGKLSGDGSFGKWSLTYSTNSQGWNDQTRVRSYWAVDPHYDKGVYPEQYRTADNDEDVVSGEESSNTALTYISYNDIQKGITDVTYAQENTFGEIDDIIEGLDDDTYEFQGEGYKRVGTHILIAAELLFDDEVDGGSVADKYCYEGQYWTATDAGEKQVNLIKYMVKSLTDTYGTSLYTKQAEGEVYDLITADDLAQKFSLVEATVKGGDGRLMLQLDGTPLYKKVKSGQTDTYPSANDELQDLIYEISTVKHFSGGKMYYAVPIEHMNPEKTEDDIHKWMTGSYGVVRNHWYKVNVSAISKPGTSVDNPDQPIIPNDEPDEGEYIAFDIVVVPWHVIEQDVTF